MHEVPSALSDHGRNPGGEVIISGAGPGGDTQDRNALDDLFPWQSPGPVGCEHGDFETPQRREAAGNLMDVHLSPAKFRKVAWTDHENANRPLRRLVLSSAGRFAGSYITYHDPSAPRPPALASRVFGTSRNFAEQPVRKRLRDAKRPPML